MYDIYSFIWMCENMVEMKFEIKACWYAYRAKNM